MPLVMAYPYEKLMVAVDALSTSPEPIRKRLFDAYMSFHPLKTGDFLPELQRQWIDIYESLTSEEPAGNEGRVQATLDHMSEDVASELAEKIVNLFLEVARRYYVSVGAP